MLARQATLALDEALANDICLAVADAVENTFGVKIEQGKTEVGVGPVVLSGDMSGIVGLVQDELEATLTFCMQFETMKSLLPAVLGNNVVVTHEIALDAISEITNMTFNKVKTNLNSRGYHIRLGIPTAISARGHFISHFHRGHYMIVPFKVDNREFQVHVAVHNTGRTE